MLRPVITAALVTLAGAGCWRRVESPPPPSAQSGPHEPGISVTTYGKGPVQYDLQATNKGDGAKSYRFIPKR